MKFLKVIPGVGWGNPCNQLFSWRPVILKKVAKSRGPLICNGVLETKGLQCIYSS